MSYVLQQGKATALPFLLVLGGLVLGLASPLPPLAPSLGALAFIVFVLRGSGPSLSQAGRVLGAVVPIFLSLWLSDPVIELVGEAWSLHTAWAATGVLLWAQAAIDLGRTREAELHKDRVKKLRECVNAAIKVIGQPELQLLLANPPNRDEILRDLEQSICALE